MYITKLLSAFIPLIAACSTSASAGEGAAGITGEWQTFDGSTFPYTKWLPSAGAKPEAIVVCVHGISADALPRVAAAVLLSCAQLRLHV